MDQCPSCGARLTGEPSWCPRCLARFDQRVAAPVAAAVHGARGAPASSPPAMYSPFTPLPTVPATPLPTAPPASAAPGKNPIPQTVVKAILLGIVLQVVSYGIARGLHMEPASAVALGLGLTLAFYLVVLSMVHGRLFDTSVKPVWHIGEPGTGVAIGVGAGAVLALVVVGIISALVGHVSSDANAVIVFAQGGAVRIATLVAVSVVAAPFVEELLFRGLLAESLRGRGRNAAIWLSALAFALWHLRPNAIWYYLLVGALLGLLYWKRGLVCSMAAHATFNGLLTVIAAMSLAGPAHVVSANGVSMSVPASWQQTTSSGASLAVRNPSGAAVFVNVQPDVPSAAAQAFTDRLSSVANAGPDVAMKSETAHAVVYPAGSGAQVEIVDHGHAGSAVLLATPKGMAAIEFVDGGNAKARADFDKMLQTLRVE